MEICVILQTTPQKAVTGSQINRPSWPLSWKSSLQRSELVQLNGQLYEKFPNRWMLSNRIRTSDTRTEVEEWDKWMEHHSVEKLCLLSFIEFWRMPKIAKFFS